MKRFNVIIWILFFSLPRAASAQTQPAAAPQHFTLAGAVRQALANNPGVKASAFYAKAVQQGIAQARSNRYPRLDFTEGFSRSNNPVYVFGSLLTQKQFTATDFALNTLNAPLPLDNFLTQFSAAMPLYDAGQTSRMIKDARLQARSASQAQVRTQQEIIFQVVQAYTNELLAREGERVAQSAVQMTESDMNRAQAREQAGLAVPSDVLSVQVQLAQAKENLLQAQNGVALALSALNVAMGLPEDAPTSIEGRLDEMNIDPGALADRQARALLDRPDLQQARLGKDRATNGVGMARAQYLPQISLFSAWDQSNQQLWNRGGNNWMAGAMLTFNVFDGGAKYARVAEARNREHQAAAMEQQMTSGVKLQVREAYLNLKTAQQRVQVARDAVAQAKESLRILQNRYQEGLITITDLLQAETANISAQKNYLNALFDERTGYAALELASGELSEKSPAVTQ